MAFRISSERRTASAYGPLYLQRLIHSRQNSSVRAMPSATSGGGGRSAWEGNQTIE